MGPLAMGRGTLPVGRRRSRLEKAGVAASLTCTPPGTGPRCSLLASPTQCRGRLSNSRRTSHARPRCTQQAARGRRGRERGPPSRADTAAARPNPARGSTRRPRLENGAIRSHGPARSAAAGRTSCHAIRSRSNGSSASRSTRSYADLPTRRSTPPGSRPQVAGKAAARPLPAGGAFLLLGQRSRPCRSTYRGLEQGLRERARCTPRFRPPRCGRGSALRAP
mmetsp:Transcript_69432/g.192118  ORF Transcript_69432/g.192118 Transcript_69432/m.192118 type:complete len:222 (+) Transcript_69432:806-1471(+)